MAKKSKRSVEDHDSSSSYTRSTDEDMSPDENKHRRRRSKERRKTSKKQGKVIIQMLSEIKEEIRKQSKQLTESKVDISKLCKQLDKLTKSHNDQTRKLEKLTESHNDLCKQLKLHTNSTSGDDSHAPRSQPSQMKSPKYRLVFRSQVADKIEKRQIIDTSVALVDGSNDQTIENGPLASATVELVVVNAEFNQHDNQYNWSREDFESNIKKARQGNPTMGYVDQPVKSIVSNGRFNLVHGAKLHSGSTIFSNSSNKKVRLGVMVVSATDERVLEGLSNPFYVRGHDRPARQSNMRHNRSNRQRQRQEVNGEMPNVENPSCPNSTQTERMRQDITEGQSQVPFLENTTMLSRERPTSTATRTTGSDTAIPSSSSANVGPDYEQPNRSRCVAGDRSSPSATTHGSRQWPPYYRRACGASPFPGSLPTSRGRARSPTGDSDEVDRPVWAAASVKFH